MSTFIFANNVKTTLAAAASPTATTLTLASSANLPTLSGGEIMPLVLNDAATGLVYEIVYVTAITGASLTVTRGQENTTAQSWNIGDIAFCGPTAGTLAPAEGNPSNTFEVANATAATQEAIPISQADSRYAKISTTTVSVNTTLTTSEAGVILAYGTITLTLPSGSGNGGIAFQIINVGTGTITIVPSGTDTIGTGGATSLALSGQGQNVLLTANGASPTLWLYGPNTVPNASAANQAVNLGQFPATLSADGSTTLPNGLIMKWGSFSAPNAVYGAGSYSYPTAFPNHTFSITTSIYSTGQGNNSNFNIIITNITPSGINYTNQNSTLTVNYIAIGQ